MKRFLSAFLLMSGLLVVADVVMADITNVTGPSMTTSNEYNMQANPTAFVFQTGASSRQIDTISVALDTANSPGSGTFTMAGSKIKCNTYGGKMLRWKNHTTI